MVSLVGASGFVSVGIVEGREAFAIISQLRLTPCGGPGRSHFMGRSLAGLSGDYRPLRPVIHTISTTRNIISEPVCFSEVASRARRFSPLEEFVHLTGHLLLREIPSGRVNEREPKMRFCVLHESPFFFWSVFFAPECLPEHRKRLRCPEIVAHEGEEVLAGLRWRRLSPRIFSYLACLSPQALKRVRRSLKRLKGEGERRAIVRLE